MWLSYDWNASPYLFPSFHALLSIPLLFLKMFSKSYFQKHTWTLLLYNTHLRLKNHTLDLVCLTLSLLLPLHAFVYYFLTLMGKVLRTLNLVLSFWTVRVTYFCRIYATVCAFLKIFLNNSFFAIISFLLFLLVC